MSSKEKHKPCFVRYKLSISFGPTEDGIKMRTLFARELEVAQRFGRAPPSHLESELQKYVESLALS